MLPNLIIPGAPKSATTSLGFFLSQSPEVFFLTGVELRFFAYEKVFKKGISWYESFFENTQDKRIRGETSNIYMFSEKALLRIKQYLPDVRFIISLRNPVDRAFSQYNYCLESQLYDSLSPHSIHMQSNNIDACLLKKVFEILQRSVQEQNAKNELSGHRADISPSLVTKVQV